MVKYKLDTKRSEELENSLKKSKKNLENKINEFIHGKGAKLIILSIIGFMPRSKKNKKHAKDSNPLKSDKINLGTIIYAKGGAAKNKGSFGYLVFPDEGRGKHNLIAQEFFARGLANEEENLFKKILELVEDDL